MIIDEIFKHLIGAAVGALCVWAYTQYKAIRYLRAGLQALLRDRIIQVYNHYCKDKGWIPIYAKDSLTACYLAYEALGENGVINDLYTEIRSLPNYPSGGDGK